MHSFEALSNFPSIIDKDVFFGGILLHRIGHWKDSRRRRRRHHASPSVVGQVPPLDIEAQVLEQPLAPGHDLTLVVPERLLLLVIGPHLPADGGVHLLVAVAPEMVQSI